MTTKKLAVVARTCSSLPRRAARAWFPSGAAAALPVVPGAVTGQFLEWLGEFPLWDVGLVAVGAGLLIFGCRVLFLEWFSRKKPAVRRDLIQLLDSQRRRAGRLGPDAALRRGRQGRAK